MRKAEHMKGESVAQSAVFEGQAAREAAGLKEFTDVGRLELPYNEIGGVGTRKWTYRAFFLELSLKPGAQPKL